MAATLTPRQQEQIRRELERRGALPMQATEPPPPPIRIEQLRIRDKAENIIPLIPNEVQTLFLDEVVPRWRQGDYTPDRPRRDNVLKFRQPGFSTIIQALLYIWATTRAECRVWTVAADDDGAMLLWRMADTFYRFDPRRVSGEHLLKTRFAGEGRFLFEGFGSEIVHVTSGKVALGRGTTLSALHLSELAWWSTFATRGGVLQAVPANGHVFEETTAHGFNAYQAKYAKDKRGETTFKAWFFPWTIFPQYSSPVPEGWKKTPEEERIQAMHHLSEEQLVWRREKKRELDETDETPFEQEYPLTDVEAFVTSGAHVFNMEVLAEWHAELLSDPPKPLDKLRFHPKLERLAREYREGRFVLYEWPQEDDYYIFAGDTAQGVSSSGKTTQLDYCSGDILRVSTWEQVGHLHGRWEPHEFGWMICELFALFRGRMLVGVERQNHGHAVIQAMRYNPIEEMRIPDQEEDAGMGLYLHNPVTVTNRQREQTTPGMRLPGWDSTGPGKAFADDKLRQAVSGRHLKVNVIESVEEMMQYVHLPGGRSGGQDGAKDDRVRSLAIGAALLSLRFERPTYDVLANVQPVEVVGGYGNSNRRR